jgi:hypothetical protein
MLFRPSNKTSHVIPSSAPHVIPSEAPHVIPSNAPHVIPSNAPHVIPSEVEESVKTSPRSGSLFHGFGFVRAS